MKFNQMQHSPRRADPQGNFFTVIVCGGLPEVYMCPTQLLANQKRGGPDRSSFPWSTLGGFFGNQFGCEFQNSQTHNTRFKVWIVYLMLQCIHVVSQNTSNPSESSIVRYTGLCLSLLHFGSVFIPHLG